MFNGLPTSAIVETKPSDLESRQLEQLRIDIFSFLYDNIFQNLFTELVNGAVGTVGNLLTGLISDNPLGIGKRDLTEQQRIDILSFLYDNIFQNFFTEMVNGATSSIGNLLTGLISSNPLGIGKRDLTEQQRVDILSFLYDNIFQNFFTEMVNGATSSIGNLLTGLISSNPLGIGKRDLTEEQLRIDIFSFLYDNIFQNFFTELVNGATSSIGNLLTGLISSNPLGIGKRDLTEQQRIDLLSFLYDNILQNFFTELVNGAVGTVGNLLTGLISDNPLGIGKRDLTEEQRAQLRIDIFSFLYDNILQNFFAELVNGAVGTVGNLLTGLISDNPLNIGRK